MRSHFVSRFTQWRVWRDRFDGSFHDISELHLFLLLLCGLCRRRPNRSQSWLSVHCLLPSCFVALFLVIFEDRAGGHFFGAPAVPAGLLCTLLDMLIHPLLFLADPAYVFLAWHDH